MNRIQYFVHHTLRSETVSAVEERLGIKTSVEQLLIGLLQATGEDLDQLAERQLSIEDIISLYRQSDAFTLNVQPLAEIKFDESIIPRGTERAFLEQQVKHKGEIWVVHKTDVDPFPSSPHAHNYESCLKLHLGTGDLYLGKKVTGNVGFKALSYIRSQLSKFALPPLASSDA